MLRVYVVVFEYFSKPNFSKIISFIRKRNIINFEQTRGSFSTRLKLVVVFRTITWSRADSLLIRSRHLYASAACHSVLLSLIKLRAELTENVCPPLQHTSSLHSVSLCYFIGSIKSADTKHPPPH
jgi:hypothetical protein